MSAEAFPLHWPAGFDRTSRRSRAAFKTRFAFARDGLIADLRRMHASYVIISTNIPLRKDGIPYSGQAQPADPGVAVYFLWKQEQRVLACDRWDRVEDNLHAIELAVQAMRGLDRWGVSQILDRAFAGFTALPPPPKTDDNRPWWEILDQDRSASLENIEATYREYAKMCHPDTTGDGKWCGITMVELNRAISEARKEKRATA